MNTYRFMEWDLMDVFILMLSLLLVCGIFLCVFFPEKRILTVKCIVKNKYVIQTTLKKCKELNK